MVVTRAYTAYIWRDRRKSWPYESLIGIVDMVALRMYMHWKRQLPRRIT